MFHQRGDRGVFIKRHHAPVTDAGADGGEFLKPQRGIEQVRWDQTDDGTADNNALELTAPAQAATDDLDDVADGDTEFDFIEPRTIKK